MAVSVSASSYRVTSHSNKLPADEVTAKSIDCFYLTGIIVTCFSVCLCLCFRFLKCVVGRWNKLPADKVSVKLIHFFFFFFDGQNCHLVLFLTVCECFCFLKCVVSRWNKLSADDVSVKLTDSFFYNGHYCYLFVCVCVCLLSLKWVVSRWNKLPAGEVSAKLTDSFFVRLILLLLGSLFVCKLAEICCQSLEQAPCATLIFSFFTTDIIVTWFSVCVCVNSQKFVISHSNKLPEDDVSAKSSDSFFYSGYYCYMFLCLCVCKLSAICRQSLQQASCRTSHFTVTLQGNDNSGTCMEVNRQEMDRLTD